MQIKWEKLPERLYSEALKCLLCSIMKEHSKRFALKEGFAHCCVYMTRALVTNDDEAFTKEPEALMKSLEAWLYTEADEPGKAEVESFLETHSDYVKDRTKEVLERATECPEFKPR